MENALDRAAEVERKTYRESLQNNRDMVLLSKQLVTIKTDVAVDFEPEKMRAQEPDAAAARALFTELEFTTLVQDFLTESVELGETDYREAKCAAEVEAVLAAVRKNRARCWPSRSTVAVRSQRRVRLKPKAKKLATGSYRLATAAETCRHPFAASPRNLRQQRHGAVVGARRLRSRSGAEAGAGRSRRSPRPFTTPRPRCTSLRERGIELAACSTIRCSTPTCSIPTYTTYGLADVALRTFNLKLSASLGRSRRHHTAPRRQTAAKKSSRPD